MCASASSLRQRWWQKRRWQVTLFSTFAVIVTIIITGLGGFIWFLTAAILFPLIGILTFVPRNKRSFLITVWMIYMWTWIIGSLFYFAFWVNATLYPIGGLAQLLIGADIPRLIVSMLIGIALALVIVIGPIWLPATFAALWLLALNSSYGLTYRQAMWMLISLKIRFNQPIFIVEDGKVTETLPKGWPHQIGGPTIVIIRPYNAVVFEKAGQVTRIEGPGTVRMMVDERIKEAVDLRLRSRSYEAMQVLTRDRVPLNVTGGAAFRVQRVEDIIAQDRRLAHVPRSHWETRGFVAAGVDAEQDVFDDSLVLRQSVFNAAYIPRADQKWFDRVAGDVESEIRKAFRTYDFDEIYNPDIGSGTVRTTVLEEMTKQIITTVRSTAQVYGVHVFGTSIKTIEIDKAANLHNAYFNALVEEWSRRSALTKAQADQQIFFNRAAIQSKLVKQLSDTLKHFRQALTESDDPGVRVPDDLADRFIQLAERLLENIISDHSTAQRYLETMVTLARMNPATILAAGMDLSQMADLMAAGVKPANGEEHKSSTGLPKPHVP